MSFSVLEMNEEEMEIQKRNRCEDWVAYATSALELRMKLGQKSSILDKGNKRSFSTVVVGEEDDESDDSDGTFSRPKIRGKINFHECNVTFSCEWKECSYSSNKISQFYAHINKHVNETSNIPYSGICSWNLCEFQSENVVECVRHINYHAYKAKLIGNGKFLADAWNIKKCKFPIHCVKKLPNFSGPFNCEWFGCEFSEDKIFLFFDHVSNHVDELKFTKGIRVSCPWKNCFSSFNTKFQLRAHIRKHTNEKLLACPSCEATFAANVKYEDHCLRQYITEEEENQCQYCLKYFSSLRLLREHLQMHLNRYKCAYCSMTCHSPSRLASHVRYRHMTDRFFSCEKCSFKFKNKDDLVIHANAVHVDHLFECDICPYRCATKYYIRKHIYKNHSNDDSLSLYCCHICSKKYRLGSCLGKHLKVQHGLCAHPGHVRFRYMICKDGKYRLQDTRYTNVNQEGMRQCKGKDLYVLKVENANKKERLKRIVLKTKDESKADVAASVATMIEENAIDGELSNFYRSANNGNVIFIDVKINPEL